MVAVVLVGGYGPIPRHFLDYGDNIRATHHVQQDDDEAAIETAHRLNVLPT